jgi:quinol monooxygenase YgiN
MAGRVMFATMKAQPGKRDELRAAFADMFIASAAESGTQEYTLIDADEADTLYVYERYEDQAAMDEHMAGETLAALYPAIGPLLADGGAVTGTIVRGIG